MHLLYANILSRSTHWGRWEMLSTWSKSKETWCHFSNCMLTGLVRFFTACGINHQHTSRCSVQGFLCIPGPSKKGNAWSMLRLSEPWRSMLKWASLSALRSKPPSHALGMPFLRCSRIWCWPAMSSVPFAETHVAWGQTDKGEYLLSTSGPYSQTLEVA